MENALEGLPYLRGIDNALKDEALTSNSDKEGTRTIIYNLCRFLEIGTNSIYQELLRNYEYTILMEYKNLLELVIKRLPKEFKKRNITGLQSYFLNQYNEFYDRSLNKSNELSELLKEHQRLKQSIEAVPMEEIWGTEEFDRIHNLESDFEDEFFEMSTTIAQYADDIKELDDLYKIIAGFSLSDIFDKIKELYNLVESKLKDVSQPEDVFVDSSVPWIIYTVFNEFDLIQEIEKDKFEEQIKYKNRKYTFKGKDRKKKVLARAIYLFSDFVQSEYQEKWQKRMATQFDIKSYRNIRNKIYEEEVFRRLEKRIAPFKSLLN